MAIAMTNHQRVQVCTQSEQNKPILAPRMARIINQESLFIREHGLSLLEGHSVLSIVLLILPFVPLKLKVLHIDNIFTLYLFVKTCLCMSNVCVTCGQPSQELLALQPLKADRQVHAELAAPVDFAPVPNLHNNDYEHVIHNFVDDAIHSLANPISFLAR